MSLLVNNVGNPKNPWDDVPIEVLIEFERQKRQNREDNRPRIHLPISTYLPNRNEQNDENSCEDSKIVIQLF